MKPGILLGAALAVATSAAFAANFVINNESRWDIHRLYVSSSDSSEWGEDQLGDDILRSGQTLTLRGVGCDEYDVKMVDEDGDVCELRKVNMCGGEEWTITDATLLNCISSSR